MHTTNRYSVGICIHAAATAAATTTKTAMALRILGSSVRNWWQGLGRNQSSATASSWVHENEQAVELDWLRPRPCHQLRTEDPSMRKAIAVLVVVAAAVAAACMQIPTEYRFVVCIQSGDTLGKAGVRCAVVDTVHP